MSETWLAIPWTCAKCKQSGTAPKVHQRHDETPEDVAKRFQKETRWSCVNGCQFSARVKERP